MESNQAQAHFCTSALLPSQAGPCELFVSDIHGEYEAFSHLMRSSAGVIRAVVEALNLTTGDGSLLTGAQKDEFATLIYYPQEKLAQELSSVRDTNSWLSERAQWLFEVLKYLSQLRAKPCFDAAIIPSVQELLQPLLAEDGYLLSADDPQVSEVLNNAAPKMVIALCETIQRLAVGNVHMVGDVYDRGPAPDLVMEELERWPLLDVQWGNHDMLWMGAALGQRGCVANVVRICARYGNLSILHDTYGMDLSPLYRFAMTAYADDPCVAFGCKGSPELSEEDLALSIKVQKAMAFIQFKTEAQIIKDNPSFGLENRNLLHRIDFKNGTVELDGTVHELLDKVFPTVDPQNPYAMTPEEEAVLQHLVDAFTGCKRLQRHIALFLEKGSLYKVDQNMLLFHACVPLEADGSFKEVSVFGNTYKGKALFDAVEGYVRDAFKATDPAMRKKGLDFLWYLWLGEGSPLFAKSKMATFELYLVASKEARKEAKNAFYALLDREDVLDGILKEFGLDPKGSHIVCGHVPVKVKDGEDPVKCNGKAVIIDGGMSKAYQSTTGIAGFALLKNASGLALASLEPFCGTQEAILQNKGQILHWRSI